MACVRTDLLLNQVTVFIEAITKLSVQPVFIWQNENNLLSLPVS